jgi:hypothetical protein
MRFEGSGCQLLVKCDKLLETLDKLIVEEPKLLKAIDMFSSRGGIIQGFLVTSPIVGELALNT